MWITDRKRTLTLTSQEVVGEVFTSVHDMTALAAQELRLMNTVQNYISTQQAKLRILSVKLEQMLTVRSPDETTEKIIGEPIRAYSLIRRLTREWPLILNLMMDNIDLHDEASRLPKEDDLDSAMRGLMRLQEVYKLDTKQLTQDTGNVHLTALDCFEMGKHLIKEQKYNISALWFRESLEKNVIEGNQIRQERLLAHLFISTFLSGCDNGSKSRGDSKVLEYLMTQHPNHALDQESAPLYIQALSTNCPRPGILNKTEDDIEYEFRDFQYSRTCRGIGLNQSSELRCFYVHYNNPQLLIAPFKLEEQNIDPPILMFHDVIKDQEIEEMKEAFSKDRSRCMTIDPFKAFYRTCDVGWIEDDVTAASARLTRRVGDMTNMNMEMSEDNQMASYGLGGAYYPHYDFIPNDDFPDSVYGNRIATLMFYLNDVESGGHTVFPLINVAVKPVKGSAVFWFNIDNTSRPLKDALHGGCPVLKGSKWVLNKWIHEGKQASEIVCPADEIFPKRRYYLDGIK